MKTYNNSMKYTIHTYADAEASARAIADLILEKATSKKRLSQKLNLAISGGSTPRYLFTILADLPEYRTEIPWEVVRFFWVDERCVEPTDAESNFGMTYDALLQYAFVPAQNIFRMKGEDIPENEVERYQQILRTELPARNGFPVFDLVLLGMGDDGHTASIFPNNTDLLEADMAVAVATHPTSGQKRITLTGKAICEADRVAFLVNGSAKAAILKEIVEKSPAAKKYPAAHVHNAKGVADFYLDKEAASALK